MKAILALVIVVPIVGMISFARMFGFKVSVPTMRKGDAAVLFAMCLACAVIAQKGTNDPPRGASAPYSEVAPGNGEDAIATSSRVSPSRGGTGGAVTIEDVDRMFSVVSVGTNEVFDFTMPAGATRVREWWLRGGSNDKAFVPGSIAMIGGEILDKLPRPSVRYCPLKATSLLVAGESEFWHQETASNSTMYTWKDAYLWRNLSLPFSMQAEIFDDGDFEYRYDLSRISDMDALTNVVIGAKFGTNELGDVSWLLDGTNTITSIRLHRLSEFDWDGDGLANEIDPDPEPLPHVALSSPNTIFVNDDDDNHNGTNDYLDAGCAFSALDDDIVPVVVEFKSLAYVTNGTLRLSAQGLRIWENQDHIGSPVQSMTMTNCATPFETKM